MYFLHKIHKKLDDVLGFLVVANCGLPTEKASELLDNYLKPLVQSAKSNVEDFKDFLRRIKVPDGTILVTADVLGLYLSIPQEEGLEALSEKLETCQDKEIAKEDLLEMDEYILKNSFLKFNSKTKQQISGTAIGTKFTPPFSCVLIDKMGTKF